MISKLRSTMIKLDKGLVKDLQPEFQCIVCKNVVKDPVPCLECDVLFDKDCAPNSCP